MWVDPEDDPRDTGTAPRGEKAVLAEYLDHFRMTFEMKCEGLDAEQLAQRSVPPSSMSLLGLVRHLASVEFHWFRRFIEGHMELARPFKSPEDRDLDFNGAVADPDVVAEAWAAWRGEVAHAREVYERYDDLGTTSARPATVRTMTATAPPTRVRWGTRVRVARRAFAGRARPHAR